MVQPPRTDSGVSNDRLCAKIDGLKDGQDAIRTTVDRIDVRVHKLEMNGARAEGSHFDTRIGGNSGRIRSLERWKWGVAGGFTAALAIIAYLLKG